MSCPSCHIIQCDNPADLQYSLQSDAFFSPRFVFVLDCPPGYTCQPGGYPNTITIPPGTITLPPPPITPGQPTTVNLLCCNTPVSITIPAGANQTTITTLMNQLMQQCAEQYAICENINNPPTNIPGGQPPIPPPGRVNKFSNDAVSLPVCSGGGIPILNIPLPSYAVYDEGAKTLTIKAGILFAASKSEANILALQALNSLLNNFICDQSECATSILSTEWAFDGMSPTALEMGFIVSHTKVNVTWMQEPIEGFPSDSYIQCTKRVSNFTQHQCLLTVTMTYSLEAAVPDHPRGVSINVLNLVGDILIENTQVCPPDGLNGTQQIQWVMEVGQSYDVYCYSNPGNSEAHPEEGVNGNGTFAVSVAQYP